MNAILLMYSGNVFHGLDEFKSNLQYLMGTGFHPEQICHSVTALLINVMSVVGPEQWDDDVKKLAQDIIVQISLHSRSFIRTSSAHPSGFYVFSQTDLSVQGLYVSTASLFCDMPVFRCENGCMIFRQLKDGQSSWVLRRSIDKGYYYIVSAEVIPPRFSWVFYDSSVPNGESAWEW